MNRKQLIATWSALLVIAFLCVSLAAKAVATTREERAQDKTLTAINISSPTATETATITATETQTSIPTTVPTAISTSSKWRILKTP